MKKWNKLWKKTKSYLTTVPNSSNFVHVNFVKILQSQKLYSMAVHIQRSEITITLTITFQQSKNKQISGFVIYGSHAVPKGQKPFI